MLSRWRANSMSEGPAVLIASASARALAQSARRAGYAPLVVDFFADDDTREAAEDCICLEDGLARGFVLDSLVTACERLASGRTLAGVVYGSGFEDRPALIEAMGKRWRLIGNPSELVARLKDPLIFADLCRQAGIPHPETQIDRPADAPNWLARQRGGSGGSHIRSAAVEPPADAETYFQRRVEGRPVSALVLADGARCAILGFSEQWAVFHHERPFRFNGAVRPALIPASIEQALTAAVRRFCLRTPLVGLNSFDFLASDKGYWLLEVNPRPGATLDIFEPESPRDESLFARHVAACNGSVGPTPLLVDAVAAQIVYSDSELVASPELAWPAWARDRQPAGSRVAKDAPFCTVVARGATALDARRTLTERAASIKTLVRSSVRASAA
jgi:predicted ATP-grasp superfamily ATP-dependent carboligase